MAARYNRWNRTSRIKTVKPSQSIQTDHAISAGTDPLCQRQRRSPRVCPCGVRRAARYNRWDQASRIKQSNPHNQSNRTMPFPQGQTLLAGDSGDRRGSVPAESGWLLVTTVGIERRGSNSKTLTINSNRPCHFRRDRPSSPATAAIAPGLSLRSQEGCSLQTLESNVADQTVKPSQSIPTDHAISAGTDPPRR